VRKFLFLSASAVLIVALSYGLRAGYAMPWTGFQGYIDASGDIVPPKKLWDWLELLVVPVFLALAAWWLDGSRKRSEQAVETDRQRESTLEEYFGHITGLLLKGTLTAGHPAAQSVARTRTLSALRRLDGARKARLLQFLYESGLVSIGPLIDLKGADLTDAELDEATLRGAELRGVYFQNASFQRAQLDGADLRGSDFSGANFTDAAFGTANLTQANLKRAVLKDCDLSRANINDVDLSKARKQPKVLPRVSQGVTDD
jgi:hypothetical protein